MATEINTHDENYRFRAMQTQKDNRELNNNDDLVNDLKWLADEYDELASEFEVEKCEKEQLKKELHAVQEERDDILSDYFHLIKDLDTVDLMSDESGTIDRVDDDDDGLMLDRIPQCISTSSPWEGQLDKKYIDTWDDHGRCSPVSSVCCTELTYQADLEWDNGLESELLDLETITPSANEWLHMPTVAETCKKLQKLSHCLTGIEAQITGNDPFEHAWLSKVQVLVHNENMQDDTEKLIQLLDDEEQNFPSGHLYQFAKTIIKLLERINGKISAIQSKVLEIAINPPKELVSILQLCAFVHNRMLAPTMHIAKPVAQAPSIAMKTVLLPYNLTIYSVSLPWKLTKLGMKVMCLPIQFSFNRFSKK